MGRYLNRGNDLLMQGRRSEIYVDKSGIISCLNSVIQTEDKYICVSRPRRFGKSMTANMISAFYDRTCRARQDFAGLKILQTENWEKYANHYNVLFLNMQNFVTMSSCVPELISEIQKRVGRDLLREYADIDFSDPDSLPEMMEDIYDVTRIPFIVVIDEWDCLFREYREDRKGQIQYLDFLRDWFKDRASIGLCYMTGILPIKKYGTHSALNIFKEFSMEHPGRLAEYVGFTEEEVEELCRKYHMDYDECRYWYNGYRFPECSPVFNPRSIVMAMQDGSYHDYWNRTETYEALKVYIDFNYAGLRDKIIELLAGKTVVIDPGHFQNDMTTFSSADDVLTLLIHLGYLGYDESKKSVFIPNHEIQIEFIRSMDGGKWTEVHRIVADSAELLQATWDRDCDAVARGVEQAHKETSHLQYNDENALSYTISLAYFAAREYYTIARELPAGKGFADLSFIPRRKFPDKPAMIVELKWNRSAESAIKQIRDKNYPEGLEEYKDHLLLVGISYDKKSQKHTCRIEQA